MREHTATVRQFDTGSENLLSLEYSSDGNQILTIHAGDPGAVLHNVDGFDPLRSWGVANQEHARRIPDTSRVILGGYGVSALDYQGSTIKVYTSESKWDGTGVGGIAYASRQRLVLAGIASSHLSGTVVGWDVDSGNQKYFVQRHKRDITSLDVSADGVFGVSSDSRGLILLWKLADDKSLEVLHNSIEDQQYESDLKLIGGTPIYCQCVRFSCDGRFVAALMGPPRSNPQLLIWNISAKGEIDANAERRSIELPAACRLNEFAITKDGSRIAFVSNEDVLLVYNRDRNLIVRHTGIRNARPIDLGSPFPAVAMTSVRFSPVGDQVAVSWNDGIVSFVDVSSTTTVR